VFLWRGTPARWLDLRPLLNLETLFVTVVVPFEVFVCIALEAL
jgi:hypothetical protein